MKKFIKYSLFGMIYLVIIYFLAIMFIVTAKAEIIKPNSGIEPYQVIKIQLRGLMKNNDPFLDYGIKQTWEFAHPANKKYTGPLTKFIKMIKGDGYKMLLNHIENEIVQIFKSNDKYGFEVTILGKDKNYYKFQWVVEKYYKEGPLQDCWLTTSVSNPISLGSSI
tara:strand:+ start:79 stop:573 length:495 start_codon:yes stop_codon:yes gene_type:complete